MVLEQKRIEFARSPLANITMFADITRPPIKRQYTEGAPEVKKIIDNLPSVRTASGHRFLEPVRDRLLHHRTICAFYDDGNRYVNLYITVMSKINKLKLKPYMDKQKGTAEIANCLLAGSKKYDAKKPSPRPTSDNGKLAASMSQ
ncbi:uncharacterized protein BYT42DRAFT_287405 [Radiomyces spectabilis]|uniref:uncharacterized protein n=1 Tax=Radiomyces spectabilis TaxID=64574 RepID=UPI00221F727D|nr:uncharacterized protein BYT42DRAFT_287405 [Radiomyces spectabilis]KAI8380971.1 hypothetical protein BYT42DRAFT_287405 [Radiomyces spectabilis]